MSSPHCGELALVESREGGFADSVTRPFASISTNTIRRPYFSVLPTILEIEYGAIPERFIAAARFAVASRENAGLGRQVAQRHGNSVRSPALRRRPPMCAPVIGEDALAVRPDARRRSSDGRTASGCRQAPSSRERAPCRHRVNVAWLTETDGEVNRERHRYLNCDGDSRGYVEILVFSGSMPEKPMT